MDSPAHLASPSHMPPSSHIKSSSHSSSSLSGSSTLIATMGQSGHSQPSVLQSPSSSSVSHTSIGLHGSSSSSALSSASQSMSSHHSSTLCFCYKLWYLVACKIIDITTLITHRNHQSTSSIIDHNQSSFSIVFLNVTS